MVTGMMLRMIKGCAAPRAMINGIVIRKWEDGWRSTAVGTHGVWVSGIFVVTARSSLMVVNSGISMWLSPVGRGREAWVISTKWLCSIGIVPILAVPC